MNSDQRARLSNLIAEYDGCELWEAFDKLQAINAYVENLEFRAHIAGQDHNRALSQQVSICPYREDDWAHPEWNPDDTQ